MRRFRLSVTALLVIVIVGLAARPAGAQINWNWTFGSNTGQFTTDGTAPGGIAAPGTYLLTDFSVTSSGQGLPLGSLLGGSYSATGLGTDLPYTMGWDGSDVSTWFKTGANSFNWWLFNDLVNTNKYVFFGWATGNINDPSSAVVYDPPDRLYTSFPVTVGVANVVPEPGTMTLLATGLVGIVGAGLRRRRKV